VIGPVLEGVDVVELLRRLGKSEIFVSKVADEAVDEMGERRVVRVEDGDELGGRVFEPEIDVPGLRMLVALPGEIDAVELLAERLDLGTVSVVEEQRPMRILEIVAGEQRLPEDRDRLVLRRHEDVDGASGERLGHGARERPPDREEEKKRRQGPEALRDEERPREEERRFVERLGDPPVEVVEGHEHRDDGDDAAQSVSLYLMKIFHRATVLHMKASIGED